MKLWILINVMEDTNEILACIPQNVSEGTFYLAHFFLNLPLPHFLPLTLSSPLYSLCSFISHLLSILLHRYIILYTFLLHII